MARIGNGLQNIRTKLKTRGFCFQTWLGFSLKFFDNIVATIHGLEFFEINYIYFISVIYFGKLQELSQSFRFINRGAIISRTLRLVQFRVNSISRKCSNTVQPNEQCFCRAKRPRKQYVKLSRFL